jgi:coronin-1B/1C/6
VVEVVPWLSAVWIGRSDKKSPIVEILWQVFSVGMIFPSCFIPSYVSVFYPFRPGRFEPGTSQILEGHTGAVLDFDWNPFDDNMLASASEDSTIKIWSIPDDWEPTDAKGDAKSGQNLSDSLVDLQGHRKKVTLVKFNPTAANVLASTAADASVKIWDIERGEELSSYDQMGDLTQDIAWDFTGDHYATSCKDKIIRLHDGRTSMVTTNILNAHEGVKSVKITYLADTNKFLSTGTSKQSAREIKVW